MGVSLLKPILLEIPEQFETKRLILRAPKIGDGVMVNKAIRESIQSLRQWLKWASNIPEVDETEENVRVNRAKFLLRERFVFYIMDKSSNEFIGTCSFVKVDWPALKFEIGYWIRDSASGHGFITEAVNGLTDFAYMNLSANRIEIHCDSRNLASRKVAERCGYHLEAVLVNNSVDPFQQVRDDCIYAKVRLDGGTLGYPEV
jgi:ribosomal-protein-serine acetyltransferase